MSHKAKLRRTIAEAETLLADMQARRIAITERDPVRWAENALGIDLDTWQRDIMRSTHDRLVVVAARQSGKSVVTGAKAAFEAATHPGLRVVTVAPSHRQASLLADKIEAALTGSGVSYNRVREKLHLDNGSTVSILHGDRPDTLRGFTADLLLADELGFTKENLLPAIMPMVAASRGRLVAISSPNGPSGPLYDLTRQDGVELLTVPASQVRHFDPETIAELRSRLGPALARQELDAEFVASASSVFSADVLDAMFAAPPPPEDYEAEAMEEITAMDDEHERAERYRRLKEGPTYTRWGL